MVEALEFLFEGDSADAERAFDRIGDAERKTAKDTKKLTDTLRDFTVIATGVVRLGKSIVGSISRAGEAAGRQERAEIRLGVALSKNTNDIRKQLDVLKDFASAKQSVTNFGDEFILEMATVGASFGLTTDQIKMGVTAAVDQAEALGRSPIELMRMIARFGGGLTDSLIEVGFAADKTRPRVEEFARATAAMSTGMAEAVGSLPTSAFVQFDNVLGDLVEKLGSIVASTATFQSIVGGLQGFISDIDEALADPKKFKEVVETIDDLVQGFLQGLAKGGATVLRVVAEILTAINRLTEGVSRLWDAFGDQRIGKIEDRLEAIAKQIGNINGAIGSAEEVEDYASKLAMLGEESASLTAELESLGITFAGDSDSLAFRLKQSAEALETWAEASSIFSHAMSIGTEVSDAFFDLLSAGRGEMDESAMSAQELAAAQEQLGEAYVKFSEILQGFGEGFTGALGEFFQDAFDEDTSIGDAWRNLGDSVKGEFIGQFTDAAFAPVKSQFGALAVALRQPFEVVGNIIGAVLAPVTNIITTVIGALVTQFFTLIGLQQFLTATGLAGVATVAAGAAPLAAVWGAAAVAASIATLGGALGFAAPANASIAAGASLAQALSVPLAEGGLVLPRPGGVQATLAEAGRAELVIPLDDPRAASAAGGIGGVQVSFEGATLIVDSEETAEAFALELGDEFARQLQEAAPESGSELLFGGVT